MTIPLDITFHELDPSPAIEAALRKRAARLERFADDISACHMVVEATHRRRHKDKLYNLRIRLVLNGGEILAGRTPSADHGHPDIHVAIHDAFAALQRRLGDWKQRHRREIKAHSAPLAGRVAALVAEGDYGFIETSDGQDVYFHRNSVAGTRFEDLVVGTQVHLATEMGDEGLQATVVQLA